MPQIANTVSLKTRYAFKEVVGHGAFAVVYRARDNATGQDVAVKQVELDEQESMESLIGEIELLTVLNHRNIVKYLGFERTNTTLNIFLEYCSGGSLRDMYIRRGGLPEREIQGYVREILEGLTYLHRQGIVHRDVKAANVLLQDGTVKLADFGVSARVENLGESKTSGSPYWMAPEIIRLQGASTASDIWSLGATVVELVTTVPPFGDRPALAACHAIVSEATPQIPDSLSNTGRDFVSLCFQKTPQLRKSARRLLKHPWLVKKDMSAFADDPEDTWDKDFEINQPLVLKPREQNQKTTKKVGDLSRYKDEDDDEDGFVGQLDLSRFNVTSIVDNMNALSLSEDLFSSFDRSVDEPPAVNLEVQKLLENLDRSGIRQLHHLVEEQPDAVQAIAQASSTVRLKTLLQDPTLSSSTRLHLLSVLVSLFRHSADELAKFCHIGGIPLVMGLYSNRAFSNLVIQFVACFDGQDLTSLLVLCNCIGELLKFLEEDISSPPHGPLVCIDIINEALLIDKPYVRDSIVEAVASSTATSFFALYMEYLVKHNNIEYAGKLLLLFQTILATEKASFADEEVFTGIFYNIAKLPEDLQLRCLKILTLYSASPPSLAALKQVPNWTELTVKMVRLRLPEGALLLFLYNICHLDAVSTENLIGCGLLKELRPYLASLPAREYSVPLLQDLLQSHTARKELYKQGLYVRVFELFQDPVYLVDALDATRVWLSDSTVGERLMAKLANNIQWLIDGLMLPLLNYDIVLDNLASLMKHSSLCSVLFSRPLLDHWFSVFREGNPSVQISVLKIVRLLADESPDEGLLAYCHGQLRQLQSLELNSVVVEQLLSDYS